jgi:hypothetical protein
MLIEVKELEGWRGVTSPMNTPSLESRAQVMTTIKHCCDVAHRFRSQ